MYMFYTPQHSMNVSGIELLTPLLLNLTVACTWYTYSLMGSFVPFGGFFPTPSDYRPPVTAGRQSFTRCNACNEKYEQELGAALREGSSVPSDDHHSAALPSWLQRSDSDLSKGDVVAQVCNSFSSIMVPPCHSLTHADVHTESCMMDQTPLVVYGIPIA